MKLGNSNSNTNKQNRHTNYLTQSKKENIPIKYQKEADEFKQWFANNYLNIIEEWKSKDELNEDVINDTFIKLYEMQQYRGCIKDYRSYFSRAYYTNWYQSKIKEEKKQHKHSSISLLSKWEDNEYTHTPLTNVCDKLIDDIQTEIENKKHKNHIDKQKVKKVLEFVYKNYPLIQFELFKIYIHCKPYISYKKLADITNIKLNFIAESIKTIKQDIKNNKDFIFNKNSNDEHNITSNTDDNN